MSLLPDNASFHERVQDLCATFRGSGVGLSALDVELLDAWAGLDVPFEIIARGLRQAAEAALYDAPVGGRPFSLRSARRHVEKEISRHQRLTAGRTEAPGDERPLHQQRHQKLVALLKKALQPAVPTWVEALPLPADYDAGARQETLALFLVLRTRPFPERVKVLRDARRLMEKAPAVSAAARRASLQFHRAALARQAAALPAFW